MDRKRESDRIRNVLAALNKFRFVLALPGSIKRHVRSMDYDKAVREYKKAKSVVVHRENRDMELLRQVLEEVDRIIADLRNQLLEKLRNPHAYLEDQQRVISYLIELDCPVDPAWFYLTHQDKWICSMLNKSYEEYTDRAASIAQFRRSTNASNANLTAPDSAQPGSSSAAAATTGSLLRSMTSPRAPKETLISPRSTVSSVVNTVVSGLKGVTNKVGGALGITDDRSGGGSGGGGGGGRQNSSNSPSIRSSPSAPHLDAAAAQNGSVDGQGTLSSGEATLASIKRFGRGGSLDYAGQDHATKKLVICAVFILVIICP